MKKIKSSAIGVCVIMLVALLHGNCAVAQSDSVVVESEKINEPDHYYNHKYQYLDLVLGDETRMLKIALQPFKPNESYSFGVLVLQGGYETKISNSISLVGEINSNYIWLENSHLYTAGFALGGRWYPAKKKQIEKGLSGNNCNGYYLGLKAKNILETIAIRKPGSLNRYTDFDPTPELSVGIQKKLTRLFYVDANAFANYSIVNGELGFGILVFLGISLNVED